MDPHLTPESNPPGGATCWRCNGTGTIGNKLSCPACDGRGAEPFATTTADSSQPKPQSARARVEVECQNPCHCPAPHIKTSFVLTIADELDAMRRHAESGLQSDSIVASCNCLTKTPEIQHHAIGCKYRLISERDIERAARLAAEKKRDEAKASLEEWRFNEEAWGTDARSIRKHIKSLTEEIELQKREAFETAIVADNLYEQERATLLAELEELVGTITRAMVEITTTGGMPLPSTMRLLARFANPKP